MAGITQSTFQKHTRPEVLHEQKVPHIRIERNKQAQQDETLDFQREEVGTRVGNLDCQREEVSHWECDLDE